MPKNNNNDPSLLIDMNVDVSWCWGLSEAYKRKLLAVASGSSVMIYDISGLSMISAENSNEDVEEEDVKEKETLPIVKKLEPGCGGAHCFPLAFSPSEEFLIVPGLGSNWNLTIYETSTWTVHRQYVDVAKQGGQLHRASWISEKSFVVGGDNKQLLCFDLDLDPLQGQCEQIDDSASSSSAKKAGGGEEKRYTCYKKPTPRFVVPHTECIYSLAVSHTEKLIASGSKGKVMLNQINDGSLVHEIELEKIFSDENLFPAGKKQPYAYKTSPTIWDLSFYSRDAMNDQVDQQYHMLAVACDNGVILFINCESGDIIRYINTEKVAIGNTQNLGRCCGIDFAPSSGRCVTVSFNNGTVKTFSFASGEQIVADDDNNTDTNNNKLLKKKETKENDNERKKQPEDVHQFGSIAFSVLYSCDSKFLFLCSFDHHLVVRKNPLADILFASRKIVFSIREIASKHSAMSQAFSIYNVMQNVGLFLPLRKQ